MVGFRGIPDARLLGLDEIADDMDAIAECGTRAQTGERADTAAAKIKVGLALSPKLLSYSTAPKSPPVIAAFDALEWLRAMLWNNDPSSNHFMVPVTGFAGQRTLRRKALPIKLKHISERRAVRRSQ